MNKYALVRLEISGQSQDALVMSEVSRLFEVDNYIICAKIDSAGGASFGILII